MQEDDKFGDDSYLLSPDLTKLIRDQIAFAKKAGRKCNSRELYFQCRVGGSGYFIIIGDFKNFMIQRSYIPSNYACQCVASFYTETKKLLIRKGILKPTEDNLRPLKALAEEDYLEYIQGHHKS